MTYKLLILIAELNDCILRFSFSYTTHNLYCYDTYTVVDVYYLYYWYINVVDFCNVGKFTLLHLSYLHSFFKETSVVIFKRKQFKLFCY